MEKKKSTTRGKSKCTTTSTKQLKKAKINTKNLVLKQTSKVKCKTTPKKVSNSKSIPKITKIDNKNSKNEKNVVNVKNKTSLEKRKQKYTYKEDNYKFKNFYESETQLKTITEKSSPEVILDAFSRLIQVHANNHVREGVEVEDLIAEAKSGLIEIISETKKLAKNKNKKKKTYNFHQACLYRIRQKIFQYCLRNANQIKTPYYIQRGCMHVGQIFKLMSNQSVAEKVLGRKGPATEHEVIRFIHDENERLPLKPMKFIKAQIKKDPSKKEFNQILSGILNHQLGSRHSYVKNNLTDVGKILHIKEKLYYTSSSNNMSYTRVINLILSARQTKVDITAISLPITSNNTDKQAVRTEMIDIGRKVCGERDFNIFVQNKLYDKTYDELGTSYNLRKPAIIGIIKECLKKLRKNEHFQDFFKSM